jgi:hypothetical protein
MQTSRFNSICPYEIVKFQYISALFLYENVNILVTSARMNTNVPRIGARLPLPGSHALGVQLGILDADFRTSPLLGTPLVQLVHDYYPFAMKDGGRLAPRAVELVHRMAMLVTIRRFPGLGDDDSRSYLRPDSYLRMQHFVRRTTSIPFRRIFEGCTARVHTTSFYSSS